MARKPKTPRADAASSPAEVRVRMTAAFTYQLGPSARRTLPAGWSGMVPAAIATRLEAEKAGARVILEEEGDAAAKPPKPTPKTAVPSAAGATSSKPAATADSAKGDQADASQSPAAAAATSPTAPAAAEPGAPAATAAPETGGASVDPKFVSAEGNQTSVSAAPEAENPSDPASGSTGA